MIETILQKFQISVTSNLTRLAEVLKDRNEKENTATQLIRNTRINGRIVKTGSGCFLEVGEYKLSVSKYSDADKWQHGDCVSGLIAHIYDEKCRVKFGCDGSIHPSTTRISEPVASEPVASEPVASEPVASEPAGDNQSSNLEITSKGRGFIARLGNFKLESFGSRNTSLWYLDDDGVFRTHFDWQVITQILESAVLDEGLNISKAYSTYAQLVGKAVKEYGVNRNETMLWWKALSQLANEVKV